MDNIINMDIKTDENDVKISVNHYRRLVRKYLELVSLKNETRFYEVRLFSRTNYSCIQTLIFLSFSIGTIPLYFGQTKYIVCLKATLMIFIGLLKLCICQNSTTGPLI